VAVFNRAEEIFDDAHTNFFRKWPSYQEFE